MSEARRLYLQQEIARKIQRGIAEATRRGEGLPPHFPALCAVDARKMVIDRYHAIDLADDLAAYAKTLATQLMARDHNKEKEHSQWIIAYKPTSFPR